SRRASVSERIRRSVSAWALPRPSATASAKLANTTVSARLNVTDQAKHWGGPPTRPALPACRSRPRTLPGSLPGPGGRACAARQPPRGREWRGRTALRRSAGQWAGPSRCPCPARSRRPWRSAQNPQRRTFKAPHAKAARPPATRCGEVPNGAWAAARRSPSPLVNYEDRAAGLSHQLIRQAAEQQDADRLPGAARYHHDLGAPRVRLGHDDAGDLGAGCVDDHAARWHAVGPDAGQRLVQHRGGLLTSLVIETSPAPLGRGIPHPHVDDAQLAAGRDAEPRRQPQCPVRLPERVDRDEDPLEWLTATNGPRAYGRAGDTGFAVTGHQKNLPWENRSTIGPSDTAGKTVSAPTMRITPASRPMNIGESVRNVPAEAW